MTSMKTIKEFLAAAENPIILRSIPTRTKHKATVVKILNDILLDYPKWTTAVATLASYPVFCWLNKQTKNIRVNQEDLYSILFGDEDNERLINVCEKTKEDHEKILLYTSMMTNMVKDAIDILSPQERQAIEAVHGFGNDISKYKLNLYYRDAACNVCRICAFELSKSMDILEIRMGMVDHDIRDLYHDTSVLVKLIPKMKRKPELFSMSVDSAGVADVLCACIDLIRSYPIDGEELSMILEQYAAGKTERAIAAYIGRSSTYVRARYADGLMVLSGLLWGITTQNIIQGTLT